MTTYTHPQTFCRICVDLWAQRGWKVRRRESNGLLTLSLPDGTEVVASERGNRKVFHALVRLCVKFVAAQTLPIKWDHTTFFEKYKDDAFQEAPPPWSKDWRPYSDFYSGFDQAREKEDRVYSNDVIREAMRRMSKQTFNWGIPPK